MNPSETIPNEQHILNLNGFFKVVEVIPSAKPRNIYEQLVIVSGGGSTRAYIYDTASLNWRYTTLT